MVSLFDKEIKNIYQNSKIRTFGMILYTQENPNIVKLLRDDDYWNALDSASGDNFYVFSIKPKKGKFIMPKIKKGTLGLMVKTWDEPEENKNLLEIFNIESTEKLPLFIIFTEYDGFLLKKILKIDETNLDSSLKQLKKIFYKINKLSLKVNPTEENPVQIHDKFERIISEYKFNKTVFSIDGFFSRIRKYIASAEEI